MRFHAAHKILFFRPFKIITFSGIYQIYNYGVAVASIGTSMMIARIDHGFPKILPLIVLFYILDSLIRFRIFSIRGVLALIDTMFSAISTLTLILPLSGDWVSIRSSEVLSMALLIRSIVAFRHSVVCESLARPRMKRLVVESSSIPQPNSKVSTAKTHLQICYVTSRILTVSSPQSDSTENKFLEMKYASLLRSFSTRSSSRQVLSFSSISSLVESALTHLHSNPAHLVSVTTVPDDPSSSLIVCALLLRTGAIGPPPTAQRALQFYTNACFDVSPDILSLLPNTLMSQLKIFEKIMTLPNPSKQWLVDAANPSPQFDLKRLVLTQFDPENLRNFSLCVVEIGADHSTHRLLISDCTPAITSGSLTYLLSHHPQTPDLLFILQNEVDDKIIFYVNLNFHLVRMVAMNNTYHYTASMEMIADHSSLATHSIGPQIQLVAIQSTPDQRDEKVSTSVQSNRCTELIELPNRTNTPVPASCQIV